MPNIMTIAEIVAELSVLQNRVQQLSKTKEKNMPCGPCGTQVQSGCGSAAGDLLFECCGRLKMRAQQCEVPIPGCSPATYPVGLELSVSEFPNMGPDAFVSAFRVTDCRNGKHTRVEVMSAWEGIIKQGLGAIIPQRPEVASVVGALHDQLGQIVPGSLGALGYVAPDGTVYAGRFAGDILVEGRVATAPVAPAPNQSQVSYEDGAGHVELLYRDALNRLIQGMGAAIPAQNGAVGVVGALLDGSGNNIPGTIGYVGYQAPDGTQWGFFTPGNAFVGGDLRLMGDLLDADGNVVDFTPTGGTSITEITNITSPGGATSIWKTGSVNLGGSFTAYPTGVSLEGIIIDGTASSVMEILCSTTKSRVSFHPQSPTGVKVGLWVNGPNTALSGMMSAAEFGMSNGNYYTLSAPPTPTTLLCHRTAGNQWYGMYTTGSIYVGGSATLAGTAIGGWADDVFDSAYPIPTIEDTLQYAMANKHLPHIPTADDVVENGLNLNTILPSLLRTIEELFMQLVGLNDRLNKLEALYV